METVAIRVRGLGKQYLLGRAVSAGTAYHAIADVARRFCRGRREPRPPRATIWALKEVTFDVCRGEVLGVIGRNGAGKSTLLKILSRITEPTEGSVDLYGRVSSLLEIGTGFHPELTGRENVFLNGAILGMRRSEILRKFDEIVEFAEVTPFLDTPVKHYSTGMYLRLAFAVAAHLEPEILLVDEVLAVGDAAFQRKCLGKMSTVAKEGRTVLFVSHNIGAVDRLCDTALFLHEGRVVRKGEVRETIATYLSSIEQVSRATVADRTDREGTGEARISDIYIVDSNGIRWEQVPSGYECIFALEYRCVRRLRNPVFKFTVCTSFGQPLMQFDSSLCGIRGELSYMQGRVGCRIRRLPLSRGTYQLNVSIEDDGRMLDHVARARSFTVDDGDFFGKGRNLVGLKEICLVDQEWLTLN